MTKSSIVRNIGQNHSRLLIGTGGDGLIDLIYSCSSSTANSSIYLLRNVGTKSSPKFETPKTFCCYGEPIKVTVHGPHPWIGDIDGDSKPDVLTCVEWSVYPFFSHNAIEMDKRPNYVVSAIEYCND